MQSFMPAIQLPLLQQGYKVVDAVDFAMGRQASDSSDHLRKGAEAESHAPEGFPMRAPPAD